MIGTIAKTRRLMARFMNLKDEGCAGFTDSDSDTLNPGFSVLPAYSMSRLMDDPTGSVTKQECNLGFDFEEAKQKLKDQWEENGT